MQTSRPSKRTAVTVTVGQVVKERGKVRPSPCSFHVHEVHERIWGEKQNKICLMSLLRR